MNEQQAFKAIRNAIRLENLSRDVAAKITPDLLLIFKEVREMVRRFPEAEMAIERQFRYKQFELMLADLFRPLGKKYREELTQVLGAEVGYQIRWAQEFLRVADANPFNEVIRVAGNDAVGVTLTGGQTFTPQLTQTQLMALVDEPKVLGKTLTELFGDEIFDKSMIKKVDVVVKQGFLLGESNETIAQNLVGALNRSKAEIRAIARTSVMDMSQRAHERFWDENSDRVKLWEFDATMDYRVCPQCFPYDGKREKDRGSLPSVPRHPNCRCRILPLTATALELEKEEMAEGMKMTTVQVGSSDGTGRGPVRQYKTKAKVNGKRVPKFAKDYSVPKGERPTMGLFLRRANNETRVAVLGKENAKRFGEMLKNGRDEVDALRDIVANPHRRRK